MIGIYRIRNKINNLVYIGQSTDIERRLYAYKKVKNIYYNSKILNAIKKESIANFEINIIEECSINELNEKEIYWISYYDSTNPNKGYNLTIGGDHQSGESNSNHKITEEEVYFIREKYKKKEDKKEVYEQFFKNKISFSGFTKVWTGYNWKHIHYDVYDIESKAHYKTKAKSRKGSLNGNAIFSDEEVMELRKRYTLETAKVIYQSLDKKITYKAFEKIINGATYKHLPYYKKREKKWIKP